MLNFLMKKSVIWPIVGFGAGGLLWGLEAYRGTVGAGETFTNPFSYVLGAVAMAVFGGLALSLPKGRRFSGETIKIIGLGLIGWLAAFFVPAVWANSLFLYGSITVPLLLAIITIPLGFIGLDTIINIGLEPSLLVGNFWLEFLVSGTIMGAVYAFILKTNVIKTALWAGIGFAIAALIGPIIGNLIGNLFGSLLVSYLMTFLVIGKAFGFVLGRSLR